MLNCKQYTFSNLISGRHYDMDKMEWIETDQLDRVKALIKFKTFLLDTCRKNSKPYIAICNMEVTNLPKHYGIFDRLYIRKNGQGEAGYIAGQDYTSEMKCIKDLLVKELY